jgi:hypothetical protein
MSPVRVFYRRSVSRKLELTLWIFAALLVVFLVLATLVQTAGAVG